MKLTLAARAVISVYGFCRPLLVAGWCWTSYPGPKGREVLRLELP
jgi:hypothetical protein